MNPSEWTPEDVANEIRGLGLNGAARKFLEAGVTGMDLYSLDDNGLRKFGLVVQQRMTLVNWLKCLPPPGSVPRQNRRPAGGGGGAPRRGGGLSRPQLGRNTFEDDPYAAPPKRSTRPAAAATKTTTAGRNVAPKKAAPAPAPAKAPVSRKPNRFMGGPPMNVPESGDDGDRVECRYCGRRFASDRIDKHESICATASRKRKKFDAKKQRLSGTEAAAYQRAASKQPARPQKEMINGKPKYKVEHENLVAALRAARKYSAYEDAKAKGLAVGPPPEMPKMQEVPDDRIQCPYCGRKFGEEQYARHERFCSSKNAPIPSISRGRNTRGAARGTTRGATRGRRY